MRGQRADDERQLHPALPAMQIHVVLHGDPRGTVTG
jgi:hypothetical protein